MSAHSPSLSLEVDPLIAEAKQRARRRRLLLLALAVGTVSAAGTFAFRSSERPRSAIVSTPTCRSAQLHLRIGRSGAAAGTYSQVFTLVNHSARSCGLRGWPTLRLVLGDGRRITPRVRLLHYFSTGTPNHRLPPSAIALRPGGAASFILLDEEVNDDVNKSCVPARTMFVIPPGDRAALSKPAPIGTYCPDHLIVPPLVAGSDPRYP